MSIMVCEEIKTRYYSAIVASGRNTLEKRSCHGLTASIYIEERARDSENVQSPVRCCLAVFSLIQIAVRAAGAGVSRSRSVEGRAAPR
jgi:hypothetical protein